MAQNYKYNRVVNSKFNIKGIVSEDFITITYTDGEGVTREISIEDCFKPFRGEAITLSIATKDEQDLTNEFEEEG